MNAWQKALGPRQEGPRLRVFLSPDAENFYRGLCPQCQQAVKTQIDRVAYSPRESHCIESAPTLHSSRVFNCNESHWPHGLRLVFEYLPQQVMVSIERIGDHRCDVYGDEGGRCLKRTDCKNWGR